MPFSIELRHRTSSRRWGRALRCALIAAVALTASCSRKESAIVPSQPAKQAQVEHDEALFPRHLAGEAGTVIVHAPQIDRWPDHRKMEARVALEVTPQGQPTLFGTAHLTASTEADLESRTVTLSNVTAERFVFTAGSSAAQEQAGALVRSLMQKQPQKVPLDLFLNYLQGEAKQHAAALNMQPPPIFVAYGPAILVITNGKPVWAPIKESSLEFAVNTNWDLFQAGTRWYLRNQGQWLTTADPRSAWTVASELPQGFSRLPDDENWKEARSHIPPSSASGAAPRVFFSEQPAELILIDGKPVFEPIGQSGISWLRNTSSDVFLLDGHYYYLASGRWFTAPALEGKWSAAIPLPTAFASIPPEHKKSHVRASVPGTEEAQRAVEEAAIPRTAVISRSAVPSVVPTYDGAPQFTPIPSTSLSRASNSMYDVITDGSLYYFCYDAVWYVASTPNGPWSLATTVPPAIYSIPASSPAYHVTQVKIYETTPTTVTTGYTSGYYGSYSTGTTVVFGTGYMYPPYVAYGMYPVYYWYPYSYGYGSWYNPNNGAFGETVVAYGPYGGAGRTAAYNPSTGTYRRGYAAWDDDEIAGTARAYNPRTGTGAATRGYATEDEGWKQTAITRGDEWAYAEREREDDTTRTEVKTSRGGSGEVTSKRDDDKITRTGEFTRDGKTINTSGTRTEEGYTGSFKTSGGASGTVERSLDDGELSRDVQVNRGGQSSSISGTTTRSEDGLKTDFETSGGASGSIEREAANGTVHRSGEITRGDQSASTDFVRGSEGTVGRIESGGESIGVAHTQGGDLYASKDGEVYRKTDNGWEQRQGNDWSAPQLSQTQMSAGNEYTRDMSDRETQHTRDVSDLDTQHTARARELNDLEAQRTARTRGYQQYDQARRERARTAGGGHRMRGGGRRR